MKFGPVFLVFACLFAMSFLGLHDNPRHPEEQRISNQEELTWFTVNDR